MLNRKSINVLILLFGFLSVLSGQERLSGNLTLKIIQGVWIYADPEAEIWMKAVIRGNSLKGYAASPDAGRFTAKWSYKLREVRLIYKGRRDKDNYTESYIQIRNYSLTDDRIYTGTSDGTSYLLFGKDSNEKFMKVDPDFDPWKGKP